MSFKLLSSQIAIYQLILFFSFSLSVNYFVELKIVNYVAYVLFHLTLIYLAFYFFNFILFFIYFLYGVFFDIFLINNVSVHLITFLVFILLFYFIKKFLLNLSAYKISYIIIVITFMMFIGETLIANIFFHYPINFENLGLLFLITLIIYFPTLFIFLKIDKI